MDCLGLRLAAPCYLYCAIFAPHVVASTACDVVEGYALIMTEEGQRGRTVVNYWSNHKVGQISGPKVTIDGDLYVVPNVAGILEYCEARADFGQFTAWNNAKRALDGELKPLSRAMSRLNRFDAQTILENVSTDIVGHLRSLPLSTVVESDQAADNFQLPNGRWIKVTGTKALDFIKQFGPSFNILRSVDR